MVETLGIIEKIGCVVPILIKKNESGKGKRYCKTPKYS